MTDSTLCFDPNCELSGMNVFVARLTFRLRPLVLETLHPCRGLLFVAICAANGKMFSNQLELRREMVKTHRLPIEH
jgi:hypothetical protein